MRENAGQSLIEVLLALALFFVFITGSVIVVFRYTETFGRARDLTDVIFIAQESFEAVQAIAQNDWSAVVDGSHGLDAAAGNWRFEGTEDIINNKYTRNVAVSLVQRDDACGITDASGTEDPDTKLITVSVAWGVMGGTRIESSSRYMHNRINPGSCPADTSAIEACIGFSADQLPQEVVDRLIRAQELGLLQCISENVDESMNMQTDEGIILAHNQSIHVNGNIKGDASATFVIGIGTSADIKGNTEGVGAIVYGDDSSQEGNIKTNGTIWFLEDGDISGNVNTGTLIIEGGLVRIAGNLTFNTHLFAGPGTRLEVAGNVNCNGSATAEVDPTATLVISGNTDCAALQ